MAYVHSLFFTLDFCLLAQAVALKGSDHRRATNVSARLDAQQKKLNLPILPTTTIGSFPQTMDLRRVRREYKAKK
jgi:5-methyltetrahydropteroyltriglutamate--homocysteine methyltransferase